MNSTTSPTPPLDPEVQGAVRAILGHIDLLSADAIPGIDQVAWDALAAGGFTLLNVAEEIGGSGGTVRDLAAAVHEAAYACARVPIVETAWLAGPLLSNVGVRPGDAPLTATVAPEVWLEHDRAASGRVVGVPALRWAERVLLLISDAPRVLLVDPAAPGVHMETSNNLAGEPRDGLVLTDASVEWFSVDRGQDLLLRRRGALARAVQIAAVAQRVQDMTVEHARARKQFGRAITAFQAVQHRLTALAGDVVTMRAAVDAAVEAEADDRPDAEFLVAVAKAETSAAAGRVASAAHQVHGALGFTLEHDLGAATKRLWSWREEFGNESEWRAAVADRAAPRIWEWVTA